MTDAAGRKENLKHASDVEPAKGSGLKLSGTVKMEGKAFDPAEEHRRILMLHGGEKGEELVQHDKVKWEPRNRKREVRRKDFGQEAG